MAHAAGRESLSWVVARYLSCTLNKHSAEGHYRRTMSSHLLGMSCLVSDLFHNRVLSLSACVGLRDAVVCQDVK